MLTLCDKDSGDNIRQPVSVEYVSEYFDSFLFEGESGEYKMRERANSNLQDESIATSVYLKNGEWYYYHFSLDEISGKKIQKGNIDFWGPD